MPRINLLPWREELRARKQKQFGVQTAIAALLMGGVVVLVHLHFLGRIEFQESRNEFLTKEISALNKK